MDQEAPELKNKTIRWWHWKCKWSLWGNVFYAGKGALSAFIGDGQAAQQRICVKCHKVERRGVMI